MSTLPFCTFFEIYWKDLTEEARGRYIKAVPSVKEIDTTKPIAVVEFVHPNEEDSELIDVKNQSNKKESKI